MRRSFKLAAAMVVCLVSLGESCGGDKERESSGMAAGTGTNAAEATKAAAADSAAAEPQSLTLTADAVKHGGIRWAPAAQRSIAGVVEVPGQLSANEDHTARLGAPAQGRVISVHVQVGDRVSRDQPLVTLQSAEASTARADYNKALADLNARRAAATFAHAARERAERLLTAKAIPRQDVDRSMADDELAKSEVSRAEAEVTRTQTLLQQLGVGTEGRMVASSPISGVVLSRDATPGMVVQAGMPLVVVSDLSSLWLDVALTDRAASTLRPGARLRFSVPAFPSDTFSARVLNVGGALDPATRTLPVRAVVGNARGRLRAQMFATVWLEAGDVRNAVAVPESAMMLLDQKPVVFVAHPADGGAARFERRNVVVGGTSGGMVQILTGLTAGDLVVTDGAFALKSEFSRSKMAGG